MYGGLHRWLLPWVIDGLWFLSMIVLAWHDSIKWRPKMKSFLFFKHFIPWFRPNSQPRYEFFGSTMVESLLINTFRPISNTMVYSTKHLAPRLHNKMVLLREKIGISWRPLTLYSLAHMFLVVTRMMQFSLLYTCSIGYRFYLLIFLCPQFLCLFPGFLDVLFLSIFTRISVPSWIHVQFGAFFWDIWFT